MIRNSDIDRLRGLFAKRLIATMDMLKKTVGTMSSKQPSSFSLACSMREKGVCMRGLNDEDFQERAKLMMTVDGEILPKACIRWELKYAEIWQRYTKDLIDIIYDDDAAVRADTCLQEFHRDLNTFFLKGLPERYESLETKAGVARYAADTIHHLVVRHQVYGTTSVKAALDPRISKVQVPRDTGTTPVDEWRSLASVALATERARFTLLFGDFKYLLDNVDGRYKEPMRRVFDELQEHLRTLDADWSKTDEDKRFNYDYFRPIPSALHTGAGY